MLIKIVTVFLVGIAVLGMFGKLNYPGKTQLQNAKCRRCGRFRLGKGPCDCDAQGKKG